MKDFFIPIAFLGGTNPSLMGVGLRHDDDLGQKEGAGGAVRLDRKGLPRE